MKFKVGDKVKIVENQADHGFKIGEIVEIVKMDDTEVPYRCSNGEENWWVREEDIKLAEYTWEDFKECPIGTKITFEKEVLIKREDTDNTITNCFSNGDFCRNYDDLKKFRDNYGNKTLGKIIKIEEPTYTAVYEQEQVEEMTMEEVCKALGKNIKIVKGKCVIKV